MNVSKTAGGAFLALVAGMLLGAMIHRGNPSVSADSFVGANETPLPKDVYPESRNRLPLPKRSDMDDEYGKKVFDELTGPRLSWTKLAPLRLYSPRLAKPLGDAHHYLKFESGLGDRLTAIAVLVTAREMDNQFEWTQWEIHVRMAGSGHIDPATIDIIKYHKPAIGLGEKETVVIAFGRELLGQKRVSSETFAHALRLFGPRGTVDLTNLMALYTQTALEVIAFDQQLLAGQEPLLPPR